MDITIKSPSMNWKEAANGIKISNPGLTTAGYTMRFAYIPSGKTMSLAGNQRVIVNLLNGSLARPALEEKDCITVVQNRFITAEKDSLVFLCIDENPDTKDMKSAISGLDLKWIEPAHGCFRTDPKLEVGNYKVNLWYLIPNKNGGIHNHADNQDHNEGVQFIEFHTQLRGKGCMVKYKEQKESTEYERFELNPGQSHPLFSKVENNIVKYPWHAYVASETGALFLVFEEIVNNLQK